MEVKTPKNLTPEQVEAFNDKTRPQLEELYSYEYDKFKFEDVNIFISKDNFPDNIKKPSIEAINYYLNKIPKSHIKIVINIYFVSYHCKDDTLKISRPGRTLPLQFDILIYPKAHDKLNIIIPHEIGHVIFEKGTSHWYNIAWSEILKKRFPAIVNDKSKAQLDYDTRDNFAITYECMINHQEELKKVQPLLYDHLIKIF